ncbi:DUF616 domain-containing protein [Candidatus Kaiserbacteria bacterium]|nr:DUF616 domain-containing protein [Candidatus Kaiserbacteria bacterium]
MSRLAVYTAIFGKKDALHEPLVHPPGCDFICFTDQDFRSRTWQVVKVVPPLPDPTRSARRYKILAHEYLPEYDVSVWVDGNVVVRGDVGELVDRYLRDVNMAVFDHARSRSMPIGSLRAELTELLAMERAGKHQDDAALLARQYDAYVREGYPDTGGLLWSLALLRRHNEPDVIAAMERWWEELSRWSKRDQMSFNYVAWKTGLKFNYIPLDAFDNPYTKRLNHYLPPLQNVRSYVIGAQKRILRLLGIT